MDAADLRIFEAVARLGVMGRAAAELNTVQSNVTARIRALEESLGCRLFERHSNGVTLTDEGRRLLPYARSIPRMLRDAARAVRDDGVPRGRLIVGSLETTAALRLGPLLAEYAKAFPNVELTLRTGTTCELIEAVREGSVDGAFVCGPVVDTLLDAHTMFREELALIAPAEIQSVPALVGCGDVRIVVLRAGCSYRQRLEALLARLGAPMPRVLEFGTLEAIFACVGAGLGITMLPRALVQRTSSAAGLSILTPPAGEAIADTVFLRRRDSFTTSAMTAFLTSAAQAFESFRVATAASIAAGA
jgi:DNA-binding transcriptional LysR family regulator